ncbi:MAG: hypothetical protein E7624_01130 [Ruminococcaceae bacterium]|nr:hypothetical protein [Oscillospiraceae bacterium]
MTVIATKMKRKTIFVVYLVYASFVLLVWLLLLFGFALMGEAAGWLAFLFLSLLWLPCVAYLLYQVHSWRKLPDILVQADNNYLYIYGKQEQKISFSSLKSAKVRLVRIGFVTYVFLYLPDKTKVKIRFPAQPCEVEARLNALIQKINKYPKYKEV